MSLFKKASHATPAYQAVKLGTKINQQHAEQSLQPVAAAKTNQKIKKLRFTHAKYLGGHTALGRKRSGDLVLTAEAIGIGVGLGSGPKHAALPWSDVASVSITSPPNNVAGLGGLIRSQSITDITVRTKDNMFAYYQVVGKAKQAVLAKSTALLQAVGVPFSDDPTQQSSTTPIAQNNDVTQQLTQLSKLKEQGILTEAEFTAKKKQILGL